MLTAILLLISEISDEYVTTVPILPVHLFLYLDVHRVSSLNLQQHRYLLQAVVGQAEVHEKRGGGGGLEGGKDCSRVDVGLPRLGDGRGCGEST